MKKHPVFAVVCLSIMIFSCGCLESEQDNVITMTIKELIDTYNLSIDNNTKTYSYQLETLGDGDILIIKDNLNNVTYQEAGDYTLIDFESAASPPFAIEGDITDTFSRGNTVELKLHIIYINFTQQMYGDIWSVKLETFEEGWDSENKTSIPIPRRYIRILENEKGKSITMTMLEFINDYNESLDNVTKKITGLFNSLEDGDTLIIRDTVNDVVYNKSYDYTSIDFETLVGYPFSIEGDITDLFDKGDSIELTQHIIEVTFTQQNPYTGVTWTIELETFEEGWDSENNIYVPIPQKYIQHA